MWSPPSSDPAPSKAIPVDPALREFAEDEGVPLELLQGAMVEHAELSITVAFMASTPDSRPRIDERFELLLLVGEGSYGQVYRARDHVLARDVAIKVMRSGDPETADREARALAALRHGNVVRIYDQGRADDYRWIVMEWLDGPTLYDWSADKSPSEILARYVEAGRGLAAAHRCGLVHRDFKGNNVMLDGDGKALLVDFGLARTVESLAAQPQADRIVGALPYLAPERLSGQRGDARSDQFAFCVVLWEALTGANPFFAGMMGIEERLEAMRLPPWERRRIPRRVRAALERGLSVEPAERWASMDELLAHLEAGKRRGLRLISAASLVLVTCGLLLGSVYVAKTSAHRPLSTGGGAKVMEAIRENNTDAVTTELWASYSAARLEHQEATLLPFVILAAQFLEREAPPREATDAWMMAAQLSRECGLTEVELEARKQARRLIDQ